MSTNNISFFHLYHYQIMYSINYTYILLKNKIRNQLSINNKHLISDKKSIKSNFAVICKFILIILITLIVI